MSIYGNQTWTEQNKYMVARSSKLKASDTGHIYDLVFETPIQQGMAVRPGDYLGDGLQLRKGAFAKKGEAISFVCDVPLIYEEYKTSDQFEFNYINKKGKPVKTYEIVRDDIFGVSDYGFSTIVDNKKGVQLNSYVVVDEAGKYKELSTKPSETEYGFIGQVMGFEKYQYDTVVLITVLKNTDVAAPIA